MFIWLALCCALLFVLAVVPEAKFPTSIFGVVALSLQFYDGSKGVDFQFIQFFFLVLWIGDISSKFSSSSFKIF